MDFIPELAPLILFLGGSSTLGKTQCCLRLCPGRGPLGLELEEACRCN